MSEPPDACLREDEVLAFAGTGATTDEQRARWTRHVDGCSDCRRVVAALVSYLHPAVEAGTAHADTMLSPERHGTEPPVGALPGDLLGGRFRVRRTLGWGGMGVVLEAEHEALGERVALKLVHPSRERTPEIASRFLREARTAARLRSRHTARVLDAGTLDDGRLYLAMELCEGRDLARELAERGPLPAHEAARHVLEACDAVAEAHALGIVHRDLKPANLFLSGSGSDRHVKVLDFGLAKARTSATAEPATSLTSETRILGSPAYMSPEQLKDPRDVDARSDVWALGVVLYELVSGATPFRGATLGALWSAILTEPAPRLDGAPPELAALVARCLEKDRDARVASVAELALGLAPFAGSDGARLADAIDERLGRVARRQTKATPPADAPARATPTPRRASLWVVAVTALALGAAGTLAVRATRSPPSAATATTSTAAMAPAATGSDFPSPSSSSTPASPASATPTSPSAPGAAVASARGTARPPASADPKRRDEPAPPAPAPTPSSAPPRSPLFGKETDTRD